jgi:hypothetical protein
VLILALLVATLAAFVVAVRRWWLPPLASVQGCGVGHYTMRGDVIAGSQPDFDAWVRSQEQP